MPDISQLKVDHIYNQISEEESDWDEMANLIEDRTESNVAIDSHIIIGSSIVEELDGHEIESNEDRGSVEDLVAVNSQHPTPILSDNQPTQIQATVTSPLQGELFVDLSPNSNSSPKQPSSSEKKKKGKKSKKKANPPRSARTTRISSGLKTQAVHHD